MVSQTAETIRLVAKSSKAVVATARVLTPNLPISVIVVNVNPFKKVWQGLEKQFFVIYGIFKLSRGKGK